ncbi:MAG: hypothetical protein H6R04_1450 [Burkholderiaceae bacterium]|nr:hypothetical protein [Burkholderiaceae bacterium]
MQQAIVALIVAAAFWAVVKRYTPPPLRRRCRSLLAKSARHAGWRWLENRLNLPAQAAASSCADGCGSCGGCGPVAAKSDVHPPDVTQTISLDALKQSMRR